MLNPLIEKAYRVLDGEVLAAAAAHELAAGVRDEDTLDLVSLANKVRAKFAGRIVPCSILNAKSGVCSQNCRFCSQSAHHHTGIETYPLLAKEEVLSAAGKVADSGVAFFGYVTSGFGYLDPEDSEFRRILETMDALHEAYPQLNLCVSIGILSEATAKALSEHHVSRYNMNLQVAPQRYRDLIATTHTIDQKIQTIRYLQQYGVSICCGGIIGLGETMADRVDLALAMRELKVDGAPLNVLIPIPGTALEKQPPVSAAEVARSFAMIRLVNPSVMLKFAAGRETVMKDFMGLLMLSGLNSLMTGGYLTTRGRTVAEDGKLLRELEWFG